ncbi:MAG TPA: hypothetical protein VLC53_01800 [Myxococcota bacterium]|nr:hypothetical protein [Myxococcota bacterium]
MSAIGVLGGLGSAARRRRGAILVALALPLILAAAAVAWRVAGTGGLAAALLVGTAATLGWLLRSTRRLDEAWAARQLDARRADLEDSAGLLLREPEQLNGLQRLQRWRVEQRLAEAPAPDLRPAWPGRALALSWALGAAITTAALLVARPEDASSPVAPAGRTVAPTAASEPQLVERHLEIEPPAYTGLPARSEDTLDAKVPTGSQLRWRLMFEPQPASVELAFHDGSRIALAEADGEWTAERRIDRSALYRVAVDGADAGSATPLNRLEAIPDRPPTIRVLAPTQAVTLIEAGQRQWLLEFEASDDYGLGPARLQVTLAQGGGENVTVTERSLPVRGKGDARQQRYSHRLDLAELGLAAGDDVIVRLRLDDNRRPTPNSARSASLILRWPMGSGEETTGMEGIVRQTLPAYFRSQRQVIIDTEALIAERGKLTAERFESRSDAIGVDQRLLRLRYGQFLGEEVDDGPEAAHEDHDHEDAEPTPERGTTDPVLEQFGHTHDIPEAATLLDRETRELLRAALGEMWQAELHLRQGQPERALPYEYRALDRIKQVQQASRIYLARVGLELPPIDATRRLTGEASGVRSRVDPLAPATPADAPAAARWQKLGVSAPTGDDAAAEALRSELRALASWIGERESELPEAIELLAAIDALGNDPACAACRQQLRALLWPLLPSPATATGPRAAAGASGTAYLEALEAEANP